jgi:general transcription factor IIIA
MERKHKCTHEGCDKAYFHSHHLKRHQKLHLEERPEVCPVCSSRFTKKCHLRKHIASTHKKNGEDLNLSIEAIDAIAHCTPYSCPFDNCDKEFVTEGKLKKHLEKHNKAIHHCTIGECEESFAFKKELMKHINEEHESKCSICDKILKNPESLKKHLKIHENEEYQCPFDGCFKVYTRQSNLNVHMKKCHSTENEKEFKCEKCEQKFSYKSTLERHIETVHEKIHPSSDKENGKRKKLLTLESFFPKTLVL